MQKGWERRGARVGAICLVMGLAAASCRTAAPVEEAAPGGGDVRTEERFVQGRSGDVREGKSAPVNEIASKGAVRARTLTGEDFVALAAHVEEAMTAFGIPGTSVGIVQEGRVVFEQAFGIVEKGREIPVTPETLMMIGSTTQTLTTLMMAILVDEGVIDWDTPVQHILPRFAVQDPELSKTITVSNLLCACTGGPRRDLEIIFNFGSLTAEAVIDSLASFEFFTDFGEAFQCSNQMFAAGGFVAAAALSTPYGQLLEGYTRAMNERVFGPIGMKSTTVAFDDALRSVSAATPHGRTLDGTYEPLNVGIERFAEPLAPAGAAWSTTRDMTRYLQTLLAGGLAPDGTRVVSRANLDRTFAPQVAISAHDSYGLGWAVTDYYGQRMLSHGGNTLGFTSELAMLPEASLGITILVNAAGATPFANSIRARLLELAFDQPLRSAEALRLGAAQTTEELARLRNRLAEDIEAEDIAPFLGPYQNDALGTLRLEVRDDRLIIDVGEFASAVLPVRDTTPLVLMTVEPPFLGFEFTAALTEEGAPTLRIGDDAAAYTFTALSTPKN